MKRFILMVAVLGLAALASGTADAAVVYDLGAGAPGKGFFDQQNGNNMYLYGDDVTLNVPGLQHLNTITLTFTYFTNDGTGTYTPDLAVSVFEIDPTSRTPIGSELGSVSVNNQSFIAGNPYLTTPVPLTLQQTTFDFTSQNIILPQDFAFFYRDNNPAGIASPGNGFSVIGSSVPAGATVGQTNFGFLSAYPNDSNPANRAFYFNSLATGGYGTTDGNLLATIKATAVPEPATIVSAGLAALIGLGVGWRRRKANRIA